MAPDGGFLDAPVRGAVTARTAVDIAVRTSLSDLASILDSESFLERGERVPASGSASGSADADGDADDRDRSRSGSGFGGDAAVEAEPGGGDEAVEAEPGVEAETGLGSRSSGSEAATGVSSGSDAETEPASGSGVDAGSGSGAEAGAGSEAAAEVCEAGPFVLSGAAGEGLRVGLGAGVGIFSLSASWASALSTLPRGLMSPPPMPMPTPRLPFALPSSLSLLSLTACSVLGTTTSTTSEITPCVRTESDPLIASRGAVSVALFASVPAVPAS